MIRKRAAAAIVAVAVLPLAACSGSNGDSSGGDSGSIDSLTIVDYYDSEPVRSLSDDILTECAAEAGVPSIDHQSIPGPSLIQKVLQQASSKTLPDILMLDNPDIKQIAETGALAPLGDYGIDAEGYAPGPVAAATYNDELYALQPGANTIAIFYNVKMLEDAGIEPPETWDELKEAALALTSGDTYGFAFNATNDYEGTWQFLPPMWTNGGDETDLTSPEVAEALQLWVDLVDSGAASKSVVNWAQSDVNDQFMAGKAAMMLNGPWQLPLLRESGVEFGVVPFPVNEAGQTTQSPLGGEGWTVPQTGNKDRMAKAAEVIKCLNSDENQLKWGEGNGVIPSKLALGDEFVEAVPDMAGFVDAVATARARTGKLGPEWPEAAKVIYTGVQLALTGQASAEDAMAKAGAE